MLNISLFNIESELRGIMKAVSRVSLGVCNPPPSPEYLQNALFFQNSQVACPQPLYYRMVDL